MVLDTDITLEALKLEEQVEVAFIRFSYDKTNCKCFGSCKVRDITKGQRGSMMEKKTFGDDWGGEAAEPLGKSRHNEQYFSDYIV